MEAVSRLRFFEIMAWCGAAVAMPALIASRETQRKPNIVYIMADDMGIGHVGFMGQKLIRTPNIDRIAAEGMRFTQCYSGAAVCAPSRSCLMTGQHTGHTTVRNNSAPGPGGGAVHAPGGWRLPLQAGDVTVAEVMKKAGYVTGMFGKWGLGETESVGQPNKQGWDEWFGYVNQRRAHEYYTDFLWRNDEKYQLEGNKEEPKTDYSHDVIAEKALEFIHKYHDRPFFLYLPFTIPHAKMQVPELGEYADKDWPKDQQTLAAMITRMDRDIGRVMALLEKYRIDKDTIVFFTSDNGCAFTGKGWDMFEGVGAFRAKKGALYEGGLRVPMAVRWPGRIKPNTESDFAWAFWDFLPTAADLARVNPPGNIDGISILPTLLGRRQKPHDFLYWEVPGGNYRQAVRMGDWKAVRSGMTKPIELYNLKTDVSEKNDVAMEHPDVVAKIEAIMKREHVPSPYYPSPAVNE